MTTPILLAWSYSRYSDYQRCPLFFKLKYLDKSLVDEGSAAMQRGTDIHKMAELYTLGKIKKLPKELVNFKDEFAQLKTLSPLVEQLWGFKNDWSWSGRQGWFGDDIWLRAKADVALTYDDTTGEVIDHKTGRKYGSNEEQVGLMSVATFRRFPELTRLTARLWYLDVADKDEKEEIFEYTAAELLLIQRDWDKKVRPMFNDRRFAPKPNQWCGRCPASKAKGGVCQF